MLPLLQQPVVFTIVYALNVSESLYEYKWYLRNQFIDEFTKMENYILSAGLQGIPQQEINNTLAASGTIDKLGKIGAEYLSLMSKEEIDAWRNSTSDGILPIPKP